MVEYVAVHLPKISSFNAKISEFLAHSADFDSAFFVDISIAEQNQITETINSGEQLLEYGPMTPDVIAMFIRLSGDGLLRKDGLDEIDRSLTGGYQAIDIDQAETAGLHSAIVQAIEEEVVQRVYASRNEFKDFYLVYEIE